MVNRCQAVGVGIIIDAVIDHMTNYVSLGCQPTAACHG